MDYISFGAYKNAQKQALIRKNYKEIYAHELAHKQAAGNLAGPIVIERNSEGIPIGGHVSIQMPSIDKNNPKKAIEQADIVIKSAMAPKDPSNQDYKVAAQAKSIKHEAEDIQKKNKLDYYA